MLGELSGDHLVHSLDVVHLYVGLEDREAMLDVQAEVELVLVDSC